MTDTDTIREAIAAFDGRVEQAVTQLAAALPLAYVGTHTELSDDGTFDHQQLYRARRFDVLFTINSIDRFFNPRSFVAIAPRRSPWVDTIGPWYWPSRLLDFLDDVEPMEGIADDRFDQQIAVLDQETDRLETLMNHPPGQLPWRDDFVAWRERTRAG